MHSSLAVTTEGLPLGLAAMKFWTRKKFKGTKALKRNINPTRVPIEQKESVAGSRICASRRFCWRPARCVHIGDRESDIYELFCRHHGSGLTFWSGPASIDWPATAIIRSLTKWRRSSAKGFIELKSRAARRADAPRSRSNTGASPSCRRCINRAAFRLELTVLHATERGKPERRDKIEWKLITDMPVSRVPRRLRSSTGMRCAGRSRPSTRY